MFVDIPSMQGSLEKTAFSTRKRQAKSKDVTCKLGFLGFCWFAALARARRTNKGQTKHKNSTPTKTTKSKNSTLTTRKKGMTGDGDWNFQSIEGIGRKIEFANNHPKTTPTQKHGKTKGGDTAGHQKQPISEHISCQNRKLPRDRGENVPKKMKRKHCKLAVSIKSICLLRPIIKRFAPRTGVCSWYLVTIGSKWIKWSPEVGWFSSQQIGEISTNLLTKVTIFPSKMVPRLSVWRLETRVFCYLLPELSIIDTRLKTQNLSFQEL